VLQEGLPISWQPFERIAKELDSDEETVLRQIGELKNAGIIRRIGALINYRALGKTSTLVTAHVPQENLPDVAEAINSLEGVSHNYLRNHFYNLWFTLQAQTDDDINVTLSNLSKRFGIDFYSLPVKRFFKLDVRFDAVGEGSGDCPDLCFSKEQAHRPEPAMLNANQKLVVLRLQDGLDLVAEPFDFLCSEGLEKQEVLEIIAELIDKGVIRRVAAVVNYRKFGFVANVLFVGEVPEDRVVEVGEKLARLGMVSHCYERKTFENWPYNMFAMMHSQSIERIQQAIYKFIEAEAIESFQLLPTIAELKKKPVKHKFY
jgi:DNA-binding Lrp family transcriptional regulator